MSSELPSSPEQLPLLSPAPVPVTDPQAVTGCWAGDERLLRLEGCPTWVTVWFHFFEGGEAILSLRCDDQAPQRIHGQWQVQAGFLVASFSRGTIRAPFSLEGEVLRWGGEMLLRLPDGAASLPYGIKLPYRTSAPDRSLCPGAVRPHQV